MRGLTASQKIAIRVTTLLIAAVAGCGGGATSSAPKSTVPTPEPMPPPAPGPSTWSISGTIRPAAASGNTVVALTGGSNLMTITGADGSYKFTGLTGGAYTVAPNRTGFQFSPASQNVTVGSSDVTKIDFEISALQHSVTLSWSASTSMVSGYNLYRSTVSGTGYMRLNEALIFDLSYVDKSVEAGTTYFYVASAVDASGTESLSSNEVSANIP